MVREPDAPPTREPRVPEYARPRPSVGVVVATFANVLAPLKYGMLPMTAAVEVERPPNEMTGVVPPEEMMGQVPVTAVTPEMAEDVAMKARPPVTFDHPSTCPPTPVP